MKTTSRIAAAALLLVLSYGGGHRASAALDAPVVESPEVMQNNAAAGDPSAQFSLAMAYLEGKGVAKDPKLALEWYRKAAAAGYSAAQYNLGVMLINGEGAAKNEKEAVKWFYAAAQHGDFEAQKAMVKSYTLGRGVEKSPAMALTWDMIARRTLQLRYGADAGLPQKPGALRADGAVEVTGKDGKKEWQFPDGSRERIEEGGVRRLEHPDGRKTTVQPDGGWQTVYPSGLTEQVTAQGRRTLRDAKGNEEITEPDGTRIEEGEGTNKQGQKVRIRDTFALDGTRISRRVVAPDSTYEERPDGTKVVETKVVRDDGVECLLRQDIGADDTLGKGKLTRADDGSGPKGTDFWTIKRTVRLREGATVVVVEKYSEAGFYSREEVREVASRTTPRPSGPMPGTMAIVPVSTPRPFQGFPVMTPPPIPVSFPVPIPPMGPALGPSGQSSGFDDPTAFALKPDIQPQMEELQRIETAANHFAGATEADYHKARAAAAAYIIPLPVVPQKTTNTPVWLREKTITGTTLHEWNLTPLLDDRSSRVPFGPHGAEVIKSAAWKHAETPHFIVHYTGEAEAKLTMQYIEAAYTVLTQLLNLDPARGPAKSHVFVFHEIDWKRYLQAKGHPPQLAGFAYKTELLLGAATGAEDRTESIKVLCHEVTHALISRFYPGKRLPLWMNEGLAEYIALRTLRAKNIPLTVAAGNTRISLVGTPDAAMDVEKVFTRVRYGTRTTPDRLSAFYANSQRCVQALFEQLPVEGFSTFFNALAAGNRPETALPHAFGAKCDSVAAFQRIVNGR